MLLRRCFAVVVVVFPECLNLLSELSYRLWFGILLETVDKILNMIFMVAFLELLVLS